MDRSLPDLMLMYCMYIIQWIGWEQLMAGICEVEVILFIECEEQILEDRILNR